MDLDLIKWALAFVCFNFFFLYFLVTCARLSWSQSERLSKWLQMNTIISQLMTILLLIICRILSKCWQWWIELQHNCVHSCGFWN